MLGGLVVNAKISVVKISKLIVVKHFSSREKASGLETRENTKIRTQTINKSAQARLGQATDCKLQV